MQGFVPNLKGSPRLGDAGELQLSLESGSVLLGSVLHGCSLQCPWVLLGGVGRGWRRLASASDKQMEAALSY